MSALHGFQSWQMFEARIILESHLAALGRRARQETSITPPWPKRSPRCSPPSRVPSDYLIHDVMFHRIIAQASGNPILAAIIETITSALYDSRRKTVEHSIDLRESAEMHRELYRAIRARKPQEAHNLMEQHLRLAQIAQGMERPHGRKPSPGSSKKKLSVSAA